MRTPRSRREGRGRQVRTSTSSAQGATGEPAEVVQEALKVGDVPQSPDAVRQLEDVFAPLRRAKRPAENELEDVQFDYDDVVQQSFPASDPPPPRG